jgi:isoleucyl-tRNA synthetase
MDRSFEASQLNLFHQLYKKGLVYRGLQPVFWSPSSRTALAEAELEYADDHVSPSVYVALPVRGASKFEQLNLVIWTTTPWTLPANVAVAVSSEFDYSVLRCSDGRHLVVAEGRFVCAVAVADVEGLKR